MEIPNQVVRMVDALLAAAYLPSVPRRLILEFAAFRHSIWTPRYNWPMTSWRTGDMVRAYHWPEVLIRSPLRNDDLICLEFYKLGSALRFHWCDVRRLPGGRIRTLRPCEPTYDPSVSHLVNYDAMIVDPTWLKIKIFSTTASVTLYSPLYDRLVRFTAVPGHQYLKCFMGARMAVSGTWAYSLSMLEGKFVGAVQIFVEQMAPNDVERLRKFAAT